MVWNVRTRAAAGTGPDFRKPVSRSSPQRLRPTLVLRPLGEPGLPRLFPRLSEATRRGTYSSVRSAGSVMTLSSSAPRLPARSTRPTPSPGTWGTVPTRRVRHSPGLASRQRPCFDDRRLLLYRRPEAVDGHRTGIDERERGQSAVRIRMSRGVRSAMDLQSRGARVVTGP